MENSYGIGVCNRYELFYNEDVDPLDLIKQSQPKKKDKSAEKENKASKANKTKEPAQKKNSKPDNTPKTTEEKPSPPVNNKQQHQPKPPKNNNENSVKFSDREERNNRRNKSEENHVAENRETNHETKENRENVAPPPARFDGESRGRGRGFGGRGGRGGRRGNRTGPIGEFRGKREYDRQSGMVTTGVKPMDKREGSGPYNWGSNKDQITEEQLQADNAELDTSGEIAVEKPPEELPVVAAAPVEEEATPKEEENNREMTLDEWKAMQKREKPVFKTRRAGEGENTTQWKKTYVLNKKMKDGSSPEEADDSNDEVEVHHGRKKVLLPIDFQFADTPTRGRGRSRGRGGPGGRGRGMGGRGRGSRFNVGHRQEAPKMDDERDFPSLG